MIRNTILYDISRLAYILLNQRVYMYIYTFIFVHSYILYICICVYDYTRVHIVFHGMAGSLTRLCLRNVSFITRQSPGLNPRAPSEIANSLTKGKGLTHCHSITAVSSALSAVVGMSLSKTDTDAVVLFTIRYRGFSLLGLSIIMEVPFTGAIRRTNSFAFKIIIFTRRSFPMRMGRKSARMEWL